MLASISERWSGPGAWPPAGVRAPSPWLVEHAGLLPPNGCVLDVACGRGRHALLLAAAGFHVTAIDRDPEALEWVRVTARRLGLEVTCEVVDLETSPPPDLGSARFDAVLVFNYLHRPLFPALRSALVTGGRLFYETFTVDQAERGHPKNPAFLLRPGELPTLAAPLTVLHAREGEVEGHCVASVVAERRDP